MLKNITLSAQENLIRIARQKAFGEKRTLNQLFREWLSKYVRQKHAIQEFDGIMEKLSYVKIRKKFSREEMNERK